MSKLVRPSGGSEINCQEVWREISNYIEGEISPGLRARIEAHVQHCPRCSAVLAGARNLVQVAGGGGVLEPPPGLSRRLYDKLEKHLAQARANAPPTQVEREIPLGITEEVVPLGSHLLYFWQNEEEFERGVRFLETGLLRREYCVLQGHDEVNARTLEVLHAHGFEPEQAISEGRLTVLGRRSAAEMMTDIAAVFDAARRMGASAIRYLGNLGIGRNPLPGGGEQEICDLEAKTTAFISRFPCVLVCMYDVRSLPGRMILNCGMKNHPFTISGEGLQENPYYISGEDSLPGLRHIH